MQVGVRASGEALALLPAGARPSYALRAEAQNMSAVCSTKLLTFRDIATWAVGRGATRAKQLRTASGTKAHRVDARLVLRRHQERQRTLTLRVSNFATVNMD
jgi:hypothetical protein